MNCVANQLPQLPIYVYPPNKLLDPKQNAPSKERIIHNHMCFMDANAKGEVLLGSNDLTGRFWNGSLMHFSDGEALLDLKPKASYVSTCGLSAAKYLNNGCVFIGENDATVRLISLTDETSDCYNCVDSLRYDERIETVSVLADGEKSVTCCQDIVSVWSLNQRIKLLHEYRDFPWQYTSAVSATKTDGSNTFVSTHSNGQLLMWDLRLSAPAAVVYTNEFCALTTVDTSPTRSNVLAVGSDAGEVYTLDVRQPDAFTAKATFDSYARVHRVVFSSDDLLGVCGDTNAVRVFNCSSDDAMVKVYESEAHAELVRDLLWKDGALYSCGFDRKVLLHRGFLI